LAMEGEAKDWVALVAVARGAAVAVMAVEVRGEAALGVLAGVHAARSLPRLKSGRPATGSPLLNGTSCTYQWMEV